MHGTSMVRGGESPHLPSPQVPPPSPPFLSPLFPFSAPVCSANMESNRRKHGNFAPSTRSRAVCEASPLRPPPAPTLCWSAWAWGASGTVKQAGHVRAQDAGLWRAVSRAPALLTPAQGVHHTALARRNKEVGSPGARLGLGCKCTWESGKGVGCTWSGRTSGVRRNQPRGGRAAAKKKNQPPMHYTNPSKANQSTARQRAH